MGGGDFNILKIEPFDDEYEKGKTGLTTYSLPEKKAVPMMASLKGELQTVVDEYIKHMKRTSSTNDDW